MSVLAGDVPRSPAEGDSVVVSMHSAHPDQAYELASFLATSSSQAVLAQESHVIPARLSTLEVPEVAANPFVAPFLPLLATEKALPVWPGANQIFTPVTGFDANLQRLL
jgi:maltose-binding protein MalE